MKLVDTCLGDSEACPGQAGIVVCNETDEEAKDRQLACDITEFIDCANQ
jgi:hypothetical protein